LGQYNELPVYKATYDLLLSIFQFTRDFNREYKYTVGESLKKETIELLTLIYRANSKYQKAEIVLNPNGNKILRIVPYQATFFAWCKITFCYSFSKTKMICFFPMYPNGCGQISQASPIGKLTKHHHKQLVPTGERFNVAVSFIFGNNVFEFAAIEK